uniref:Uncharacterized protein n=1 Tax=Rhizophora mucronata TaxID=61149 RepID=A0A2P2PKH0_RHIMU
MMMMMVMVMVPHSSKKCSRSSSQTALNPITIYLLGITKIKN